MTGERKNHWVAVRGSEEQDNAARLFKEDQPGSPWSVNGWSIDPAKISIYGNSGSEKTGKPGDTFCGSNNKITSSQDFNFSGLWLRVGTVFLLVLSLGMILIIISRLVYLPPG